MRSPLHMHLLIRLKALHEESTPGEEQVTEMEKKCLAMQSTVLLDNNAIIRQPISCSL